MARELLLGDALRGVWRMTMSYLRAVLQPGEVPRFHTTVHWLVYAKAILALALAILCVIWGKLAQPGAVLPFWLAAVFAAVAVILFIPAWLTRLGTEIAVTDRRIIFKTGLIQRHTIEINMDKVESVDVDQTVLGRILDFGTVIV